MGFPQQGGPSFNEGVGCSQHRASSQVTGPMAFSCPPEGDPFSRQPTSSLFDGNWPWHRRSGGVFSHGPRLFPTLLERRLGLERRLELEVRPRSVSNRVSACQHSLGYCGPTHSKQRGCRCSCTSYSRASSVKAMANPPLMPEHSPTSSGRCFAAARAATAVAATTSGTIGGLYHEAPASWAPGGPGTALRSEPRPEPDPPPPRCPRRGWSPRTMPAPGPGAPRRGCRAPPRRPRRPQPSRPTSP